MNAVAKVEKELAPWQSAIQSARERFEKNADLVSYDRESIFAMQAIMKTDYAMGIANKNPTSVKMAMINVASTGLTLNPANGYAYLVPRDNAIHLDISYKGLIKIATDTGAVRWARAELVYESDTFVYHGPALSPEHRSEPFKERGEAVGAYCIAKTSDGDILTEIMPRDEIEKIRSKSTAFTRGKEGSKGPWEEWFDQMAKKAVIKRASKTWPYTERSDVLSHAIEIANASEGGYDLEPEKPERVYAGRPVDGCQIQDMDPERQPVIRELADSILAKADAGKLDEAANEYEACDLEAEEKIALWGLLPSHHRSSIKRIQSRKTKE